MPNWIVTGRFCGGLVTQIIEADTPQDAIEEFTEADWTPVVDRLPTEASENMQPGMATLTVTVTSASADIAQRGLGRGTPTRYVLRFETVDDFFALQNLAAENGAPITDTQMVEYHALAQRPQAIQRQHRLEGHVDPDGHRMAETIAEVEA